MVRPCEIHSRKYSNVQCVPGKFGLMVVQQVSEYGACRIRSVEIILSGK